MTISAGAGDAAAPWDEIVDFVIVGSGGGGLCAALACKDRGMTPLVLEKEDKVGGSTAMSGGIFWVPANPLMAAAGVEDSEEKALLYLDTLVGEQPGSSAARKRAYLNTGPKIVTWLRSKGIKLIYCDGWPDYFDDLPGGQPRGRSVGAALFDVRKLGAWKDRVRRGPLPFPTQGNEGQMLTLATRTPAGFIVAVRVGWRMLMAKLLGREFAGNGGALQSWLLQAALRAGVDIRTSAGVTDLVTENDRVTGVIATSEGRQVRIGARRGVLIAAGGFAHNEDMRARHGPQPSSTKWTSANVGDTGEMIESAMRLGAGTAGMDRAIWISTSMLPNGNRGIHVMELGKPHLILVNRDGKRFANESSNYMEIGQRLYADGSVPSIAVLDSRHRSRFNWGTMPPGITPAEWLSSGYMKKADSIEELARLCGIDETIFAATVRRFNGYVALGRDGDFARGERAYDRYRGDPTQKPNPCLGAIDRPPFYAVEIFPGDVGTYGGLLTDEDGRVLRQDGGALAGLYATGNATASVTGDRYPGAGASIGASMIFGYRAAHHAAGSVA